MKNAETQQIAAALLRRRFARRFRRLIPFCALIAGGCLGDHAWTSGGLWLLQAYVLHLCAEYLERLDHLWAR